MLGGKADFALNCQAGHAVGMATGATIHTANGMPMRVTRRKPAELKQVEPQVAGAIVGGVRVGSLRVLGAAWGATSSRR
eukprot:1161565-Pelagomonas_calceolata.AAC.2